MNFDPLFDLYDEVQRNYNSLFPKKEEGLVVFLLYKKVNLGILEKIFSHENIIEAIEQVNYNLNGKLNRNSSPSRNNDQIHVLLNFYIIRNSKGYSLRIFAEDFCKLIEGELNSRFNPSQIEKQFILFLDALKNAIHDEESFDIWYSNFFERNKNQMRKQIEILHNDVDRIIKELNVLYVSEEIDFPSKLREMDTKVQTLSTDAKKLESAFSYSDTILDLLNEAYDNVESYAHTSEHFREIRKAVRLFFSELENALAEVSFAVDKIRPQLERLYGSFEQRELDRRLEKLVDYVFKSSQLERNESNKEEIVLPFPLENKLLPTDKTRLLYPVYYDYLSQPNQDTRDLSYSEIDHAKQYEEVQAKIILNQKAVKHFNRILAELKTQDRMNYHEHLFALVESEGSLEVAMKTTHLILRELGEAPNCKIAINPNFKVSTFNQNVAIWETKFQNSNS